MMNPFSIFSPRKMVGIDIGTSSIKVVEISRFGSQRTLENYGQMQGESLYKPSSPGLERGGYLLSNGLVSKAILAILDEAKIKTKAAIFSIPDFSTFCTSFDIPPMTEKEIPDAIRYNASQYITLPISEVTLDWKILPNLPGSKNLPLKVFLVAVPNQVIQEYQTMARLAGLTLHALEAEALGIARALAKDATPGTSLRPALPGTGQYLASQKTICIVDMGLQSATINIVDNGFLKKSYSFNFNGGQLSRVVSSVLGVDLAKAEEIKNKEGLLYPRQDVAAALQILFDPLIIEMKNMCAEFLQGERKEITQIYLTGGTAHLPGLKEYVAKGLGKAVSVPNCFSDFLYAPILEETLKQMAPSFSAAVGVALGGLER